MGVRGGGGGGGGGRGIGGERLIKRVDVIIYQ